MAELQAYEAELSAKPAEELRALYDVERRRQAEEMRRKRQARAEAEERSRFFHSSRANADFVHWSKAAYWTIDEGAALLLGKAPEVVDWESVRDYAHVSPFARQYARVRELAMRARETGQLALRTEPRAFLEWAKRTGIAYPCGLEEHVESATRAVRTEVLGDPAQTSLRGVTIEKPLLTRERDTARHGFAKVRLQSKNPAQCRNSRDRRRSGCSRRSRRRRYGAQVDKRSG